MIAIDVSEGDTMVDEFHHVDRGWACVEERLARGGARACGVRT